MVWGEPHETTPSQTLPEVQLTLSVPLGILLSEVLLGLRVSHLSLMDT